MKRRKDEPTIAYQYHPNGYQRCALCAMFFAKDRCTAVEGFIAKDGWCKIWQSKTTLGVREGA